MNFSKMIQKRPKDTKGTLKRLCKTLAPFKVIIFIVAFLSLLSCLLSLLGPYFCGEAINEVEKGPGAIDFDVVWKWALLMLFSYIISSKSNKSFPHSFSDYFCIHLTYMCYYTGKPLEIPIRFLI